MATRATLRAELARRLGDTTNAIWPVADLDGYLNWGIVGLYPTFFIRKTATTVAAAGPLQTAPAGARNIHMLGLQRTGSTRVRPLRSWQEGDGQAFIPKTGITGETLVWAWTQGWDAPASDGEVLTIPREAEEVVIIRAQIAALERLLSDRVSVDKYLSLSVRQASSEEDIATTIDALHASLRDRMEHVVPLPEVKA